MAAMAQMCACVVACLVFSLAACLAACPEAGAQAQLRLAVTFDDLPAHGAHPPEQSRLDIIDAILATLKREKMPPTYGFLNGVRTEEHPETMAVLQAWRVAGQPLGNHTWSHPNLADTLPYQFEADIEANQPLLRSLMGAEDWRWFRYPFLQEGETVEKHREVRRWLADNHYQVAEVTMDFEDYLWNEPYTRCSAKHDTVALQELHDSYLAKADEFLTLYRAYAKAVWGRDIPYILLMHVGAFDARMLPELLQLYRTRGFSFITLPQAAADPAYHEDPDVAYVDGDSLTDMMAIKRNIPKAGLPPHSKPYDRLKNICR